MKFSLALTLILLAAPASAQTITADAPLSRAQKREIVRLVEDITSNWRADFSGGQPPNDEMILFGLHQTSLRSYKLFRKGKKDEHFISLPARQVEAVTRRYFARVPRHRSIGKSSNLYDWTLRNGLYSGGSEMFEQGGVEEVKRIRIVGAGRNSMTVWADFVDGMASATSEPEREVVVKIKMTLKKSPSNRLFVWSHKSLTQRF